VLVNRLMEESSDFKPKLSSKAQIRFFKKDERGEFYVIGAKGTGDYLKIHSIGKDIVEMLDGNTTVNDIISTLKSKGVDTDVPRFVTLLANKGLLENVAEPKKHERTSSLLIHYIPLFKNTEQALRLTYSAFHRFFSRKLLSVLIAFNAAMFVVFLLAMLTGYLDVNQVFFLNGSIVSAIGIYALVIMPFLIAIHEFSHALVCFHYGGRPQEMGIALFVFAPFFYADTSDTWMLSKKQSIMVFLAGPLSDFFVGNLFFLISFVLPENFASLMRMVAFGSYLVVLMGFNPLIESDGYYVLQTLIDFPNLVSHARTYPILWIRNKLRLVSREDYKEISESYSNREQRILAIYAPIAALINALFIGIMGYWAVLFTSSYWVMISTVVKTFPNISAASLIAFGIQSFYVAIIVIFCSSLIKRLINRRSTSST